MNNYKENLIYLVSNQTDNQSSPLQDQAQHLLKDY